MNPWLVGGRLASIAAMSLCAVLAGCSPIPDASPLPTLIAGTWVSEDGKYSIELEANPRVAHLVLPITTSTGGPDCSASGEFPATVTVDGTWTQMGDPNALWLVLDVGHELNYGVGPARDGDWAVIEDLPCGPDYDALYLIRQSQASHED